MAGVTILFISHRVEFLKDFEKEAMKSDVIVLEEPSNNKLFEYFNGKVTKDEYI